MHVEAGRIPGMINFCICFTNVTSLWVALDEELYVRRSLARCG